MFLEHLNRVAQHLGSIVDIDVLIDKVNRERMLEPWVSHHAKGI
jgi:hypothetical protein